MKRKYVLVLALVAASLAGLAFQGCRKDPDTGRLPADAISFTVPAGWPQPVYTFLNNPLSTDGFELGRRIFYDTRLSRDNTISCASCHQQFAAFANINHIVSHGVDSKIGTRNSPGLFNLAWQPAFFWDGGVNHIESQPINPIENLVEMDLKIDSVVARLGADADYKARFGKVFGDEAVSSQRIFKALAQFMGAMVSSNAKWDKVQRGETSFTATENAGQLVYVQHCATCHQAPLFSDFSYRNNGLKPIPGADDSGRMHITHNIADLHKFKVPSLRNLQYSPPYTHDGRFATIDEVLDHYDHGIQPSASLDPALQNGIQLTSQERSDLKAFLATLNDETFVKDKRFAQP